MDDILIGQTEATRRWKAARIRLSETIQEFSEATSIFTRAIFCPTSLGQVEYDIESTLEDLDLELPRLALDDKIFTTAHTQVKETRNASKRIVPISRLPLSILSQVFDTVIAWADDCCDRNGAPYVAPVESGLGWKTCTVSLTSVCSTWRRIIVETPSYWSHIDTRLAVKYDKWWYMPTEYSKLCLQRANNTALELHIYVIEKDKMREDLSASRSIECFHGQTISSISFELSWAPPAANSILDVWTSTLANAVTSLKIKSDHKWEMEQLPIAHMHEQLHTLDLVCVTTAWSQIRFPGLVNLSLDAGQLPIDQLRDILVASPALRTLIISGENANADDLAKLEGAPVELSRLVFLGLGKAGPFDVILLLQMIRPGPECMALSISRPQDQSLFVTDEESHIRMWQAIQTFCIQHKVSHLSLDVLPCYSVQLSLAHFLHSLTDLHTLALWYTSLYIHDSVTSQFDEATYAYEYMTPPTLQRLYLSHTEVPVELWHMVSASSIVWLRMDSCFIRDHSQALVEWLERSVPEFHLHQTAKGANVDDFVCSSDCELPWWLSAVTHSRMGWSNHSRLYM